MKIETIISNLTVEINELKKSFETERNKLLGQIETLINKASVFSNNWYGKWASPDFNVYHDFTRKNELVELDKSLIQDFVEKGTGLKIKEIDDDVNKILKSYKNFQENFITELAIIKGNENLESEIELLNKIESEEWGMTARKYIKLKMPSNFITYDPELILNKGVETPPHLRVDGELFSLLTTLKSTEDFEKKVKRILRQLEIKYSIEETSSDKSDFITKIINSFHSVSLQLKNRYDKRETFTIKDEYDVQDLLKSLLAIEFEDIRPEEYTPSFAGSSTRVDFLLKNEKIVIEVKKTRKGLSDKEIGDQLILDSQHYKVHPDCKHLICFVYDPENRIKNPRGLENDLNNLTTEDLIVSTYIRP